MIKISDYIAIIAISVPITYAIQVGPFQLQLSELTLLIAFGFLAHLANPIRIQRKAAPIVGLYVLFLGAISLSIPGAIDQLAAFKGFVKWFLGFLTFILIIVFVNSSQNWLRVYHAFYYAIAMLMMAVIAAVILDPHAMGVSGFEVNYLISENRLGQFACISVICSVISISRGITFLKGIIAAGSAYVLVISFNKTAYIVCAFLLGALFVIMALSRRSFIGKTKSILNGSILLSALVAFGAAVFEGALIHRAGSMLAALDAPLQYTTVQHRFDIWSAMMSAANENLFGIGLYNTREIIGSSHAHSVIFELVGTSGYPGLIAFLLLISALFLRAATLIFRRDQPVEVLGAVFSAFAYFFMNLMSDSFGPSTHLLFWIPAALFVIAPSSVRTPPERSQSRKIS